MSRVIDLSGNAPVLKDFARPKALKTIAAVSGALTGAAANGAVFSFRNILNDRLLLRRLRLGVLTSTAFGAAQALAYALIVARSFTASDSAQTAVAVNTANNADHDTEYPAFDSVDCRISNTGAITAGTRTLDTVPIATAAFWSGAIGAAMPLTELLPLTEDRRRGILLRRNEGFVITNTILMGATGVVRLDVQAEIEVV